MVTFRNYQDFKPQLDISPVYKPFLSGIQGALELSRHISLEVAESMQGPGDILASVVQLLKVMGGLHGNLR